MLESLEGKRKLRAPVKDWLTKSEVVAWFEISDTLLTDWITKGLFPAGVPWTGKDPRWRWIDVVFREVWLEVESRLARPGESPGITRMDTDEPGMTRNRPK